MHVSDESAPYPSQSSGRDACLLGGNDRTKPQLSEAERSALLTEAIALQEQQQKILARLVSSDVGLSTKNLAIQRTVEARPDGLSNELQAAPLFIRKSKQHAETGPFNSFHVDPFLGFGILDAPQSPHSVPSSPTGSTNSAAPSHISSSTSSFNQGSYVYHPDLFSASDCFNFFMPSVASPLPYTPASPPPFDLSSTLFPSTKPRAPPQPKRVPCPHQGCPKFFSQRAGLNSHLVTHTGNRQYVCEICNKSYTTNNRLTVHKRTHSGERPYKCTEPGCDYAATQMCTLKNHMHTHLDSARKREIKKQNSRTVPCLLCGKLYKTAESLAHHTKTGH